MLNLIVKDILVQKKTILLGFAYAALMMFSFSFTDAGTFTAATFAVCFLLIQTPCAWDDKNHGDTLLNSLPIRRESIVTAKFLSVLVYVVIAVAQYLCVAGLVWLTHLPFRIQGLSLEAIIGLLAVVALFAAIFYPVYFRFGYMKTRYLNIILFCGLFAGGSAVLSLISANDSAFGQAVAGFFAAQPDWVIASVIVGLGLLLLLGSYGLSLRFYKRREF